MMHTTYYYVPMSRHDEFGYKTAHEFEKSEEEVLEKFGELMLPDEETGGHRKITEDEVDFLFNYLDQQESVNFPSGFMDIAIPDQAAHVMTPNFAVTYRYMHRNM